MTKTEGATAEAKPEGPVSKEIATEIEEAVIQEFAKIDEEKETEEKSPVENTPKEGEGTAPKEGEEEPAGQGEEESKESEQEPQGEESPEEPEGEEDASEAEAQVDELLTRAVRSGISLKDARTIVAQDADALERQIQLLEKVSQPAEKVGEETEEADVGETASAEDDPLTGIPDLDPEVYDENIVSGFQAMKSVIRKQGETINKQGETIKRLSSGGEKSWFNQQVESLGVKNLDAAKRTELNEQFDVLKAGYAAKGQKVDDIVVFQKATKFTLGDEIKAAVSAKKSKKLQRRTNLQTARPGGPAAKAKGDPLDEVAEEINKEFFNKK